MQIALKWLRFPRVLGTARATTDDSDRQDVVVSVGKDSSDSIPFTPASLVWKDVSYSVTVGKDSRQKMLLHSVSGLCEPGSLVALMGATGGTIACFACELSVCNINDEWKHDVS